MKGQAFLNRILVILLIVVSFNINTVAQGSLPGRDIKEVIGKDDDGNDYNMLVDGDLTFVDENGDPVDPITIESKVRIYFDFNVEAHHLDMLHNGDYFEFDLPEAFKVSMILTGSLSDELGYTFGTYHIGTDGKVRFEFTNIDDVDLINLTGNLKLNVSLNSDFLEDAGEKKITLPVNNGKDYEFILVPTETETGISKSGVVDKDLNPEFITWEVLINRDFSDLNNVVVADQLPIGLSLIDIEVYPYIMDLDGGFVGYGDVIGLDTGYYTQDGSNISFDNIKTAFAIVYKTRIDDSIKPDEGGTIGFENNVSISADDVELITTKANVSAKYGVLLTKKSNPVYNGNDNSIVGRPGAQTFTWNIEYNYGDKTIVNPTLIDEFDTDLEYVSGSMVLKYKDGTVVSSDDYTVVNTGNKLEIIFNTEVRKAINISYKTAIKEGVLVTDETKYSNTVSTGGSSSSSTGTAQSQLIKKTSPAIDYDGKTISWNIDINTNRYELNKYSLVDKYLNTNKGMKLIDESLVVFDVDADKALVLDVDYIFEKTYDENLVENGYKIVFVGAYASTQNMLKVSFKTDFDTRVLVASENFVNQASLIWTDKNDVEQVHSSQTSRSPLPVARNNGQKNGVYDHISKEITWTSEINYNGNPLKNSRVEDIMLNDQVFVEGSLVIRPYTVAANGAITRGDVLDLDAFDITYPSAKNNFMLTIKLPNGEEKYTITYKTSVEGNLILEKYDNTLNFFNEGDIMRSYSNSVKPPKGGKVVGKSGKQNGAVVNWTIEINGSQSTIEKAVIKDTPSDNQFYLEDTFEIYPVNNRGDKYDVLRDSPLIVGDDYNLIFHKDDEGNLSFEVQFIDTLDRMYVLEYDTQISASNDNLVLSNRVELSGENYQYESLGDNAAVVISVDSAGGGAVGTRGSLSLRKLGEDDMLLEGVVFELYKDGRKIATETTDADGVVNFRRLIHGDYTIKEVLTQAGYVIPDDLYNGKTFKVNTLTSSDAYVVDVYNETSKLTINKRGTTDDLLSGSRFELLMEIDGVYEVINDNLDVVSGSITIEGVDAGKYRLIELATASDYVLNTEYLDFEIELDGNGQVISKTVDFVNYKGSVKLVKSDEAGLLAGAVFDLYHNDEKIEGGLVTDANGEITLINELAPGNYYFKEVLSANGNLVNETPIRFAIATKWDGELELVEVIATNAKGSVSFIKVDEYGSGIAGVLFELVDLESNDVVATVMSDENGYVFVDHLMPGNYGFREVKAAHGFILNTALVEFNIPKASYDSKFELVLKDFINYKGGFVVRKVDPRGVLLSGAEFALKDVKGSTLTKITTVDGIGVVNGLVPGTYTLTEVKAPKGYKLSADTFEIVIPESYEGEYVSQEIEVVNILQDASLPGTGFSSLAFYGPFGAVLFGFILILISKRKYS